jgi:hypothetical protein
LRDADRGYRRPFAIPERNSAVSRSRPLPHFLQLPKPAGFFTKGPFRGAAESPAPPPIGGQEKLGCAEANKR